MTPPLAEPPVAGATPDADFLKTIQNWAGSSPLPENVPLAPDPVTTPAAEWARRAADQLPGVGDRFAGFDVLAVLGTGTFGRVYLARQGDLADRYVALKVSTDLAGESRALARFQHTNIVPIYSVHRVPPFQAVCMPYFGATTLAHLLTRVRGEAGLPATGRQLVETLRVLSDETDVAPPLPPTTGLVPSRAPDTPALTPEPATPRATLPGRAGAGAFLGLLRGMPYTDAVCWLGARLADGLHYAHTCGFVHNDLKPANVLLTDDGQPMLLDFGVADDLAQRGGGAGAIGGTFPYMSPEHLESTRTRTPVTDPRSDVYALGIILFELLTRRHPFRFPTGDPDVEVPAMIADRQAGAPSLRALNPAVSPGLEAVIRKCLAPDPARRYQSAADLRDDLDRHRTGQALRHVRVPSVRERVRKWVRRNPWMTSNVALAAVAVAAVLGCGVALHTRNDRIARLDAAAAAGGLGGDVDSARYLFTARVGEPDAVGTGVDRCESALARYGLPGDEAWDTRPAFRVLPPEEQQRVRDRLTEACVFLARGYALRAGSGGEWLDRATAMNALAERVAGAEPPRAVWAQRAELRHRRGDAAGAADAAIRAGGAPLRTGRDYYLSGAEALAAGKYADARDLLLKSVELAPGDYAALVALGSVYDRLGKSADAVACYSTAIALTPEAPGAYYSRGLAFLRLREFARARRDLDRAAERAPGQADTYLSRAIAAQWLGDYAAALKDLDLAAAAGAPGGRVGFMRSRALDLSGDKAGARRELDMAMKGEPTDDLTWIARGNARVGADPAGALADFEAALRLNPRSFQALQNKSHALAKLGQVQASIRTLDQVVDMYPDYVPGRAGRAVMHARAGNGEAARADAAETLRRDPSAANAFQMSGVYAQLTRENPAHLARSIELLSTALRGGFGYDQLDGDKDLETIRNTPEFRQLADAARVIRGRTSR
jgi:serine/threonine protein kinase/tetratricopeptide (TPR) repeat protein